MKKLTALLLAVLLFISSAYSVAQGSSYDVGDVLRDNNINTGDAAAILKYLVDDVSFDEEQIKLADINADKAVNTGDVVFLLKVLASKIDVTQADASAILVQSTNKGQSTWEDKYVFKSYSDFNEFSESDINKDRMIGRTEFGENIYLPPTLNENLEWNDFASKYDEAFFESKMLVIAHTYLTTHSRTGKVDSVSVSPCRINIEATEFVVGAEGSDNDWGVVSYYVILEMNKVAYANQPIVINKSNKYHPLDIDLAPVPFSATVFNGMQGFDMSGMTVLENGFYYCRTTKDVEIFNEAVEQNAKLITYDGDEAVETLVEDYIEKFNQEYFNEHYLLLIPYKVDGSSNKPLEVTNFEINGIEIRLTAKMGESESGAPDTGDCYYIFIEVPVGIWTNHGSIDIVLDNNGVS